MRSAVSRNSGLRFKVLVVVPSLAPLYGGPSKSVPALAAALARRGLDVDLVTTDADGTAREHVPYGRWIARDGYRVRYFGRTVRSEYKISLSLAAWLFRCARGYDSVHINSNFNFPVLAAALACRWRDAPYVITPRGMLEQWALNYKSGKKALYYKWVEKPLVLSGASAIHALNTPEAENLRSLRLGPDIFIAANGVDVDSGPEEVNNEHLDLWRERFPETTDKNIILFLHRVHPKKGIDLLLEVFSNLRQRFDNIHLIVAGPGSEEHITAAQRRFEAA